MNERPKETFQNDQEGIPIEIPNVGYRKTPENLVPNTGGYSEPKKYLF
jgi:hypothetical protein